MQRVDKLKQKNSSPDCDQTRTITKNCQEKEERDGGKVRQAVLRNVLIWASENISLFYSISGISIWAEVWHTGVTGAPSALIIIDNNLISGCLDNLIRRSLYCDTVYIFILAIGPRPKLEDLNFTNSIKKLVNI